MFDQILSPNSLGKCVEIKYRPCQTSVLYDQTELGLSDKPRMKSPVTLRSLIQTMLDIFDA